VYSATGSISLSSLPTPSVSTYVMDPPIVIFAVPGADVGI